MPGPDPALLSLNVATVREQWSLEQCIDGCVRHGVGWIAPWRDKLADCGVERAARLIRAAGLKVSSLCRGGFFPAPDTAGRQAAIDDNRRALDEAAAIGAVALCIVAGGLPQDGKDIDDARAQVREGLAAILEHARKVGVTLAIEPLHPMYAADRSCINTLAQANELCDALGEGAGIAVDVYHVWWDPDLPRQIARAGARIVGFHVCDWLVPTTDLLLDRGMMGDGVIDIARIRALVEGAGYRGPIEAEIFSKSNWWRRDPDEVLRVVKQRYGAVC
jgi:sugar phosphate isomerase/epimerase